MFVCFGRMVKAEAKIAKDPYEVDSWNTLVMEALQRDVLTAREVFEAFFEKFPTAVRGLGLVWILDPYWLKLIFVLFHVFLPGSPLDVVR